MNDYYTSTLEEIRSLTKSNPMLVKDLENYIEKLEETLEYERKSNKDEYLGIYEKFINRGNEIKEQQAIIDNTRKTLERYELENKALRQLVGLWI